MQKNKWICIVAYTNYYRDSRVRRYAETLISDGYIVDCIALKQKGQPRIEIIKGVRIFQLSVRKYRGGSNLSYIYSYLIFFVLAFLKLTFLCFRHKYRIVHVHNMPDFIVFAAFIPRLFGSRVFLDIHDTMPESYMARFKLPKSHWMIVLLRFQEVVSARFASEVISVNHPQNELLVRHGVPQKKITVIMNVADTKLFFRRNIKENCDIFKLIYHGTILKVLGIDILIRVIAILKNKIPNIQLYILGEGDYLEEVLRLTDKLNLNNYISFNKKMVPTDQVPTLIADANLAVIPNSKNIANDYRLPVKLLECVAMGIPAVVSRIKTVEYYFDETMVKFYEADNVEDLARCIFELYLHPDERSKLVNNADKFNEIYNWNKHKKMYFQLINKSI